MPSVDVCMPDGGTYLGLQVPESFSIIQWKIALESGTLCEKVLYSTRLACYKDASRKDKLDDDASLPAPPCLLFVSGPASIVAMLDLALRKILGPSVPAPPPPVEAAPGRSFVCARQSCQFMVHSKSQCGGYCCIPCSYDAGHCEIRGSYRCEKRRAPPQTPKADSCWKPPGDKFCHMDTSHEELLRDEASWLRLSKEKKHEYEERIKQAKALPGPHADYEKESVLAYANRIAGKRMEQGWSLDYSPCFFAELAYEGFFPMGGEILSEDGPLQVMVICGEAKCSILDFDQLHISRQVRKRAKHFTMTVDTAFDEVLLNCCRMHGQAWLYRGHRSVMRQLFQEGYWGTMRINFGMHSFELWDSEGRLIAGDIGYTVGSVYSSMTGFRAQHSRNCGEIQMVLMAALLRKMGFGWIDLGQVLKYKERLGAKVVGREYFLERLYCDRDKHVLFGHDPVAGGPLLKNFLQAMRSLSESEAGTAECDMRNASDEAKLDQYRVIHPKVIERTGPSVKVRPSAIYSQGDILMGIPHIINKEPWLRMQSGWVLMDGQSLGMGKLLQLVPASIPCCTELASPDYTHPIDFDDNAVTNRFSQEIPVETNSVHVDNSRRCMRCVHCSYEVAPLNGDEGSSWCTTPNGDRFNIGYFSDAPGAKSKRPACPESSWFLGWEWRIAKCLRCDAHIGWQFDKESDSTFWCLIWNRFEHGSSAIAQMVDGEDLRESPQIANVASVESSRVCLQLHTNGGPTNSHQTKTHLEVTNGRSNILHKTQAHIVDSENSSGKYIGGTFAFREAAVARTEMPEKDAREELKKHVQIENLISESEDIENCQSGEDSVQDNIISYAYPHDKRSDAQASTNSNSCSHEIAGLGKTWIVVGGRDRGGIIVRTDESFNSMQLDLRLATGSKIEAVELKGSRLHYKRLHGKGPDQGWISTTLNDKVLVLPMKWQKAIT